MKIAVFPGTFDPITLGHVDIIKRGLLIFDKIYVVIGINPNKKTILDLDFRLQLLRQLFIGQKNIKIDFYEGLTVDFCNKNNAKFILRGLRSFEDFEYEKRIAYVNSELEKGIESVFFCSGLKFGNVSSSLVREIIYWGGDFEKFVPLELIDSIKLYLKKGKEV